MSSGKKKSNEYDQRANAAIQQVKTPDPFEERLRAQRMKFLDWDEGKDGQPKNILAAPGMDNVLDIYGTAKTMSDDEQYGQGALDLASPTSGAYADQVKKQKNLDFYNDRAAGISDGFNTLKAENTGQIGDLINLGNARKMNVAGLETQQQQNYYNRQAAKTPWWKTALGLAMGGARAFTGGM